MTVATKIAAVVRLENPLRLTNFRVSGLAQTAGFGGRRNEQKNGNRCREEYHKHGCYQNHRMVSYHE